MLFSSIIFFLATVSTRFLSGPSSVDENDHLAFASAHKKHYITKAEYLERLEIYKQNKRLID